MGAVTPKALILAGSRVTLISRSIPPRRCTCATPGTAWMARATESSTNQLMSVGLIRAEPTV